MPNPQLIFTFCSRHLLQNTFLFYAVSESSASPLWLSCFLWSSGLWPEPVWSGLWRTEGVHGSSPRSETPCQNQTKSNYSCRIQVNTSRPEPHKQSGHSQFLSCWLKQLIQFEPVCLLDGWLFLHDRHDHFNFKKYIFNLPMTNKLILFYRYFWMKNSKYCIKYKFNSVRFALLSV